MCVWVHASKIIHLDGLCSMVILSWVSCVSEEAGFLTATFFILLRARSELGPPAPTSS